MKRILSLLLVLVCVAFLLVGCNVNVSVNGDSTTASTTASKTDATTANTTTATTATATTVTTANTPVAETVYVTIVNKGTVELALAEVEATDLDEDGKVNLYEVLKAAHATCPNGGKDGFAAFNDPNYGLSMTKLWGEENNGGFGYYQNDASSWALTDEVRTGDRIVAFSYVDTTNWSDTFCYFDQQIKTVNANETVTLKLNMIQYDPKTYAPIPTPIEGAKIIVNGNETAYTTDAEGNVTLTLESGVNVISATSTTLSLVPPIAKITVQ